MLLILVVETDYMAETYDVHVIAGNTAMMTCTVPTYVQPYATVTSWIRDDAYNIFPTTRGGEYCDIRIYFCSKSSIFIKYFCNL